MKSWSRAPFIPFRLHTVVNFVVNTLGRRATNDVGLRRQVAYGHLALILGKVFVHLDHWLNRAGISKD